MNIIPCRVLRYIEFLYERGYNMIQEFCFDSWADVEDWVLDNIDEVKEHHSQFLLWWLNKQEQIFNSMTDEELQAWADRREQRLEKWAREHPEEDAELNSPERRLRMWNVLRERIKAEFDIGEYKE